MTITMMFCVNVNGKYTIIKIFDEMTTQVYNKMNSFNIIYVLVIVF